MQRIKLVGKAVSLIAILLLACAWVNGHWIQWTWDGLSLGRIENKKGKTIEFGLREDGIVVWREITTVTNKVDRLINSPQEPPETPPKLDIIITNILK